MNRDEKSDQIAAQRMKLIAPLLSPGLDRAFRQQMKKQISRESGLSERTLRRYLAFYRESGYNFRMDSMSPMALILSGQPELWDRLKLQRFAAIRQRIDMVCRMFPFDRAQTEGYLKRHLSAAGTDRDIFSEAAIDMLYAYSSGIARLINKAATNCLIYGAQSQKPIIDDHMVKQVIDSEMA